MYSIYREVCKVIREDVLLSDMTTFKIGGRAKLTLFPKSESELVSSIRLARERGDDLFVLGGGSNVLASSAGYNGVVLSTAKLSRIEIEDDQICAECGARLTALSALAENSGLSGLEFGSGIPGSLGGAIVMNAGAYGQSIGEIVSSVKIFDGERVRWIKPTFSYRKSSLKKGHVVLSAKLKLKKASLDEIKARVKGMRESRKSSQPTGRSAGCIFLAVGGVSAGYYVERAGLKGLRAGEAFISDKHAGFIVNCGNASSADVISLIKTAKEEVKRLFGKSLETEIRFLGEENEFIR